jgi:hypothetical protein
MKATSQCVSNFYNSGAGKAVKFFSPLSLLPAWNPDWSSNVTDWLTAIIGKGGGTAAVVTTGDEIITLNGTVEISSGIEKGAGAVEGVAGRALPWVAGAATLADIFAHSACYAGNANAIEQPVARR